VRSRDGDLFEEFLYNYDPTGELRKWLSDEQLQKEYRIWRKANPTTQEADATETDTSFQDRTKAKDDNSVRVLVDCVFCGKTLRLVFPFKAPNFRCPNCAETYRIQSIETPVPTFLVMPTYRRRQPDQHPPKREMTEAVRVALRLFDLDSDAMFSDVKTAFRKCMMEYHPDKVAHLGLDLRKLAEKKTKDFVAAYTLIEAHFRNTEQDTAPSGTAYRR